MLALDFIGAQVASQRKKLRFTQLDLARKAGISRATLDALENGRIGELGFSKINRVLTALGLELKVQEAISHRPTLDDLLAEHRDDQSLGGRR